MSAWMQSLHWLVQTSAGELHGALDVQQRFTAITTDTRKIVPGSVFAALKGERVDGHDFLAQAHAAGAMAALVQTVREHSLPQIKVDDVQATLGVLAKAWIATLSCTKIALTGSNGKTTVKNLTASILSKIAPSFATEGNFNNELGLPLSALSVRPEHRYAVLEMGAGQPGDIDYLASLIEPDIALVNNAMSAHLERLGSVRGVAEEKSAVYRHLRTGGTAIVNADDEHWSVFEQHAKVRGAKVLRFGLSPNCDITASDITLGDTSQFTLHIGAESIEVQLPLLGMHNVRNALAAAGLAFAARATLAQIKCGLEAAEAAPGRLRVREQAGGWRLLDDSYNANPGSVRAGIEALCSLEGDAWLVLGNMAELGPDELRLHADIGSFAKRAGVVRIFTVGEKAAHAAQAAADIAEHFSDQAALSAALKQQLHPGVNLLVKGSRSSRTELIIAAVTDSHAPGEH
jgi:UDP-N-acetylmuramoyl-tripeptide--D-alanyl-D-alanine ligase